ncbi:PREDICTED: leucine-rich repeat receptor-like serine/threonine/tyrosine-protein kinase SOBIR1 [Populus euphratica]|uniref:Leucine-rich repeat receptor-like serine/threonine/tyrosine-protein kinase SOBIR1 n=1 Tax=Populus euphratica TaxID=75702 RepID=A0AAJ6V262_POPEU|nr:PREDICTED: leucine-rich repeat receptor-like serine/threonine/tyrosine-protein kinase SOBIR1 [Populus euphratica]
MAVLHHKHHLSIFVLLSILLLAGARLNLDHSDLKAFSTIQKDLGINSQRSSSSTPCNSPGVFCERRLSPNSTFVLKITRLVFKSQRLTGFLSPAIGRLSELKELSLTSNQLVDQVPAQIVKCKKLEILELANNQFSGEIPSELSSLVRLRVLDLSSNEFSGNLSFLKHFPNLESLSLANNLFTGKVPKSIRSFRNLQFFDFSGNSFLEGPVPVIGKGESSRPLYPKRYILKENTTSTGSKNNSSASKYTELAPAPAPSSAAAAHKHKKSKRKLAGWLLGFLAGSVAGSLSGFVFSLLFKIVLAAVKGGGRDLGPAIFSPLIKKAEDLAFLEKDDGLAHLEVIGRGGCGEVFKAGLPGSNGKMIAVKKIIQPPKDAAELSEEDSKLLNKKMRQIQSEINTVGHIRHRNLLPLLAHVSRPDCHYLVYEFMKNGSLQDVLNQVTEGKRELDWLARHKIAVGVASGLEYLHLSHSPRIIHRDLKPANVLLDDDMEARIADFGLAKAMPDAKTHITTSNVAGTVGYIAPEYHQTLKFTDKCDIYSFGVVLGVLVMGKLPSDAFFQSTRELSLVKWMRNIMMSENPSQAIDPKLVGHGLEDQMVLVLKIACFCTRDDPKQRPNSKDVRCMLSQIKN